MNRKNINNIINLSEEDKHIIMKEIKSFYLDVRDEDIGIIMQQQILDLFLDQLAPAIYNKVLDDITRWYKNQQDNMESDFYLLYKEV